MTDIKEKVGTHPTEVELADYLGRTLSGTDRARLEEHIACCDECLEKTVSAYESVDKFKKEKEGIMKKINVYLVLAVASFVMSFVFQQYFLQFLTATLLLGIKWVVDSKTTKMLIMIYDAWKRGGSENASRVLSSLDKDPRNRL